MTDESLVGVKVREISTPEIVYEDCKVLRADSVGLLFEVERTLSEGGQIEKVTSQILVPWVQVKHVIVNEERT